MKKISLIMLVFAMTATLLAGCGASKDQNENGTGSANLEGSCEEILNKVYDNAELDEETRQAMENYQTTVLDETTAEYILDTTEVSYTDAVCSMPMINAIAYQCVILRVPEGQDVEETKQILADSANPRKWVCVEAESTVIENVGDVILFIMADKTTADAVKTAFLAL